MRLLGENELIRVQEDDGIVLITYSPRLDIDLETAHEMVAFRKQLTQNIASQFPVILDINGVRKLTRSAKAYLREKEAVEDFSSVAFISKNPLSNFLYKAYTHAWKPHSSYILFRTYKQAKYWSQNQN